MIYYAIRHTGPKESRPDAIPVVERRDLKRVLTELDDPSQWEVAAFDASKLDDLGLPTLVTKVSAARQLERMDGSALQYPETFA